MPSFAEKVASQIPSEVRMISGCHDAQTSADANITSFEGPVFGITGEPVSVKGKNRSQRPGVHVREIFNFSMGDVSYVMEKDALEYCTYLRHEANMDHLLFRFGPMAGLPFPCPT